MVRRPARCSGRYDGNRELSTSWISAARERRCGMFVVLLARSTNIRRLEHLFEPYGTIPACIHCYRNINNNKSMTGPIAWWRNGWDAGL